MAAGTGDTQIKLTNGEVLAPGEIDQQLLAALAGIGHRQIWQGSIQRINREIKIADVVGEQGEADLRMDQVLQLLKLVLGLGLAAPDQREDPWHDLQIIWRTAIFLQAAPDGGIE